jgi:imidazolonepropionase-like amidohydrolase
VHEALKAITIDAARALDLESEIGSLEPGKLANLTIVEANPYELDPMRLKDLAVKGVVYRGVFHANSENH